MTAYIEAILNRNPSSLNELQYEVETIFKVFAKARDPIDVHLVSIRGFLNIACKDTEYLHMGTFGFDIQRSYIKVTWGFEFGTITGIFRNYRVTLSGAINELQVEYRDPSGENEVQILCANTHSGYIMGALFITAAFQLYENGKVFFLGTAGRSAIPDRPPECEGPRCCDRQGRDPLEPKRVYAGPSATLPGGYR